MTRTVPILVPVCAAAAALSLVSDPALAQDNTFKAGAVHLAFQDSSSDLAGPSTPPGVTVDVKDATTASFIYSRLLNDNWSLDLAAGLPFGVDIDGDGTAAPLGKVAEAEVAGVTFLASYYFMPRGATWRPYVSAGYNYSKIYDEKTTAALDATLSGETDASFTDSHGPAVYAGLDYALNERWFLSGTVGYMKADTEVTLVTDTMVDMGAGPVSVGDIERTMDVTFNPVMFHATVGFGF